MVKIRKGVRKSWFLVLSVVAAWLFGRWGELPSMVPHLFSGRMEVPLVLALQQNDISGQWKPMHSVDFAGSVVLLYSEWGSQELYVSKEDEIGWERILCGSEVSGGKQIWRSLRARRRGSHIAIEGLEVVQGSLTALAFVTDKANLDVVLSPRAIVRNKNKPVRRAIVVSPGVCLVGSLFLLLVGLRYF